KPLPRDPHTEQLLECLALFMRPRHFGQLGELIEMIRATAARRQPKEQPPCRELLRLATAGRDRRRHDLDALGIAASDADAPLHLDLDGWRNSWRVGMPPCDDVIEREALIALLEG